MVNDVMSIISSSSGCGGLRNVSISLSLAIFRMRMRASVVLPGVSEGVLPPNAEPVTAQEAMHHLAKQV